MAQSSTIITLTQMCDAALNTPEVGIVNFTLLRTLLHVVIKQLHLDDTRVEYRGADSERLQTFLEKKQPGNQLLTEYSISGGYSEKSSDTGKEGIVVVTEQPTESPEFTVTMTTNHLKDMESTLNKLQTKVKELEELPGNLKLYEAIKQEGSSPVLDMFQILNLQKRMDGVDASIAKLGSMLEAAVRGGMSIEDGDIEKRVKAIEIFLEKRGSKLSKKSSKESRIGDGSLEKLEKELEALKEVVLSACGKGLTGADVNADSKPVEVRIKSLENKQIELMDQMQSLDNGFSRLLNVMQGRVDELETGINELLERIHLIPSSGEAGEAATNMASMQKQLSILEGDFENVMENIKKLGEEKAAKEHAVDVLIEQLELLKTVKADREDLEDALADKADACQINRKVSYEQFDQACGDMSKNIEDALTKITQQEALWNQTLMNIQGEVTSKMDKNELTPLREFINSKLKMLQEKFKTLAAMKKDQEAAGTKARFLRNVNCISCDKEVIMRRDIDPSMYPKPYALPPTKSMGPYLAYELDQLRKQQKCVPANKNMNVFENAMQTSRSAKSPDHICNRYCGGSHTVTTPQQRVTRLGHFMEQWGPEIAPVAETHVRGTDGKMYKARDDEYLKKLAAEKPPSSHVDTSAPAMLISTDHSTTKTSLAPHAESQSETNRLSRTSLNANADTKILKASSQTAASGMIHEQEDEKPETAEMPTEPSKQQVS